MRLQNLYKLTLVLSVSAFILIMTGCHKDNPTNSTGTIALHLHTNVDSDEVDQGDLGLTIFKDANGRPIKLSLAQMYISNVSAKNSSGVWDSIPGFYFLKRVQQEEYTIGNLPAGNYTDIRFNIGLPIGVDTTDPTAHTKTGVDSVLSYLDPTIYFGWSWQGFIYLNLTGQVDISSAKDGSQFVDFSYQVGSGATANNIVNLNLKTVSIPYTFSILPNQTQFVHLVIDYGKLLEGIDMTNTVNRTGNTYTNNGSTAAAATLVADSIPNIFRHEDGY